MKIVFLGCTKFSEEILKSIIHKEGVDIEVIFSIPQKFNISYSDTPVENTNYANLSPYAKKLDVPFVEINSVKGQRLTDYAKLIANVSPDVILVMGWYYMIPNKIRELATYGAWGIHASLLPKYAGGAPLVWAIIKGEKEAGTTLFRMEDGDDDGDIIEQCSFDIVPTDYIKDVYDNATKASIKILKDVFAQEQKINFRKQNKELIEVFPQRSPNDGAIDWAMDSTQIHNFIRAQSKPYPGAWSKFEENGEKLTFWRAEIIEKPNSEIENVGEVLKIENNEFLVKTKDAYLRVYDWEFGDNELVSGKVLNHL